MDQPVMSHIVTPQEDGMILDTLLKKVMGISTTTIRKAKHLPDGILVEGIRTFTNQPVHAGQNVSVRMTGDNISDSVIPVKGDLDIRYEDEHLLVLNKPAGLTTHPSAYHPEDSISNLLRNYFDERGLPFGIHPVNRLDRGTSGLMIFAKYPQIQMLLSKQIKHDEYSRIYFAIVHHIPTVGTGTIDAPIARDPTSVLKRKVTPNGDPAKTDYTVLSHGLDSSLLRLNLYTGRTHQIRVHLSSVGHPLVGDFLYGLEEPELIGHTALHAGILTFVHPITKNKMTVHCPPPQDFMDCLHKLSISCETDFFE